MKFNKEKQMLPAVMAWLSSQVTSVETELWCGYAGEYVPDVVGIKFDPELASKIKRKTPRSRCEISKQVQENRLPDCIHTDMIAIELKLTNFVEAYFQARMYQSFGFRSYIAMPKGSILKVKPIRYKILLQDDIGFLEVDGDECVVKLSAKRAAYFSRIEETQISERMICRFKQERQ